MERITRNQIAQLAHTLERTFSEEQMAVIYGHMQAAASARNTVEADTGVAMMRAVEEAFSGDFQKLRRSMNRAGI
jgi:hypothetical protein